MKPAALALAMAAAFSAVVSVSVAGMAPRQARTRDADWVAPADAAARSNPLVTVPNAVRGGRKIFSERCAACHGDDARGSSKAPDLTRADVQAQSDGALFWKIGRGNTRGGMPTFSFLPETQRWQVVLWLRALGSSHGRPE